MPRYFMHLREDGVEILDFEGVESFPDAIRDLAVAAARDCMAGDIREGRLNLHCRIDVADEDGATVLSLAFADAIKIIRDPLAGDDRS